MRDSHSFSQDKMAKMLTVSWKKERLFRDQFASLEVRDDITMDLSPSIRASDLPWAFRRGSIEFGTVEVQGCRSRFTKALYSRVGKGKGFDGKGKGYGFQGYPSGSAQNYNKGLAQKGGGKGLKGILTEMEKLKPYQ